MTTSNQDKLFPRVTSSLRHIKRVAQAALVINLLLPSMTALAQVNFADAQADESKIEQSIFEIISTDARLTSLSVAIQKAGLQSVLSGPGQFTLFAPINKGFAKINPTALNALLANKQKLTDVLSIHLFRGNFEGRQVPVYASFREPLRSVDGTRLSFGQYPEGYAIQGRNASVLQDIDIVASNGRIHIIQDVLVPTGAQLPAATVVDLIAGNPRYSTLTKLLQDTNLVGALSSLSKSSVFAPVNEAFTALKPETLEALSRDKEKLKKVLLNHVIDKGVTPFDLTFERRWKTLSTNFLNVKFHQSVNKIGIDESLVQSVDEATNGYVYSINSVLIPVDL